MTINVTNATNIMETNYNLTKLFATNPIENTSNFIYYWNQYLSSWAIPAFLLIIGVVIYIQIQNYREDVQPITAALYASFVTSISGIFLFVVDVTVVTDGKLLTFAQLLPILVITGVLIILDKIWRSY